MSIFFLEKAYEDFDTRLMTIKGWAATVATAAIGLGFYQNSYLWLFAAGASVVFWYLGSIWKVYQKQPEAPNHYDQRCNHCSKFIGNSSWSAVIEAVISHEYIHGLTARRAVSCCW
jgi:hypothetical protein